MTDRSKLLALADIEPQLVERMVALVRDLASRIGGKIGVHECMNAEPIPKQLREAQAIVRALDADNADLLEAREIAKPWLIYDGAYSIDNGYCDEQPAMKAILAAIKRGRELAQAEALS